MQLPKCCHCQQRFDYKDLLFFFTSIRCLKCGTKQYVTAKRKKQLFGLTMVACFLVIISQQFISSFFYNVLFICLIGIVAWFMIPFFYTFSDEEEPLF